MQNGFLSFALGAVFLLSLLSSGFLISSSHPDTSYEKYRRLLVEEVAVKQALYHSLSDAASSALAFYGHQEGSAYASVRAALFARFLEFQSQLREEGYDAIFWCGEIPDEERGSASSQMAGRKGAIAPQGALPAEACADSFDASLLERRIHIRGIGFSLYDPKLGMGTVAKLPPSYEVDFG